MLSKTVVLVGYSGHGYSVADIAVENSFNLKYYTDRTKASFNPFKLEYLGFEGDHNFEFWNNGFDFILGIGDNHIRNNIGRLIKSKNCEVLNLVQSQASLSTKLEMGEGNFVARQVVINAFAQIGDYCIINTGAIIEHECKIGDGVHIGPGAVLAGNVSVADNSFIGANSVIKQGVSIGKDVVVGAGSVILNDIPDNMRIVGNPGRKI